MDVTPYVRVFEAVERWGQGEREEAATILREAMGSVIGDLYPELRQAQASGLPSLIKTLRENIAQVTAERDALQARTDDAPTTEKYPRLSGVIETLKQQLQVMTADRDKWKALVDQYEQEAAERAVAVGAPDVLTEMVVRVHDLQNALELERKLSEEVMHEKNTMRNALDRANRKLHAVNEALTFNQADA